MSGTLNEKIICSCCGAVIYRSQANGIPSCPACKIQIKRKPVDPRFQRPGNSNRKPQ